MRYTDERFEAAQLYSGDKEVYVDYGIYSFPRIDYFMVPEGLNAYQPALVYGDDAKRTASDWTKHWNYAFVDDDAPDFPFTNFGWQVYSFGKYSDIIKGFWDARQSSEDALAKVFTAANKDEFEKLYSAMLNTLHENGLNEEGIKEMNEVVKERCGDTYEDLIKWTSNK